MPKPGGAFWKINSGENHVRSRGEPAGSAGYDLNSVAERAVSTVEQGSARRTAFEAVVNRLEDIGVPSICRLNGGVMADRPIWPWPATSASVSTAARCSCRRRALDCIITKAASHAT